MRFMTRHPFRTATWLAFACIGTSALASHSEPTFVVVSGRQAVRGTEQVCFRLDDSRITSASDRVSVRLRFRGDVPDGHVTLDGHAGPSFDDQSQVFSFNVSPRGAHRLVLVLRDAAILDWMSITSANADIEQVACAGIEMEQDRIVELDPGDSEVIDRLERSPAEASDNYYIDWQDGEPDAAPGGTIPAGTRLSLVLEDDIATHTHRARQRISTHLGRSVVVDGRTLLAAGTQVVGTVSQSQKAGRFGRARLRLDFGRAILRDGTEVVLDASVQELGRGSAGKQAGIIAGSAVGGAVAGKIVGGDGSDALIGALIGGSIAAGVIAANPGKPIVLPKGTVLLVRLESNVRVPALGRTTSRWRR